MVWEAHRQTVFANDTIFTDDILPSMLHQANLCEPTAFGSGYCPEESPEIQFTGTEPEAGLLRPLVLAACDSDYFLTYTPRLLSNLRTMQPKAELLVHIVNPSREALATADDLRSSDAGFCFSFEKSRLTSATYYASVRLLIASRLLMRYQRPMFITDIDTVFHPGFDSLPDRCAGHPLLVEHTPRRLQPSMQVSANLIYFEPHPRALAFLRAVETYLDRKFAEPHLWMADQAALFRGLCLTTAQDGSVPTFNDPVIAGGAVFPDCLVGSHILEEGVRRKKRTLGDGLGVAIDPVSLKPVWHTLPSGAEPPTAAPVPV